MDIGIEYKPLICCLILNKFRALISAQRLGPALFETVILFWIGRISTLNYFTAIIIF